MYAWHDVTLRELTDLIKDVSPEARDRACLLKYRLVYPGQLQAYGMEGRI